MTEPLTLDATAAALELGWYHRDGRPSGDAVRAAYRRGDPGFPAPINPHLKVRSWRWSRRQIVAYGNAEQVAS